MTDEQRREALAQLADPALIVDYLGVVKIGGGSWAPYIGHTDVCDILDKIIGPDGWSFETRLAVCIEGKREKAVWKGGKKTDETSFVTDWRVGAECALTILGNTKSDAGTGDGEHFDTAFKGAYSSSLTRAAQRFGLGRILTRKELLGRDGEWLPDGADPSEAADFYADQIKYHIAQKEG